ncbi:MAG: DegV family protein [Anaerolineae bacterium]
MGLPSSVAIVTDSAAGIPDEMLTRFNIQVVPFWVHMGNEAYVSGVDINPATFFEKLRANPELEVHTGVPAVAKFVEIYRQLTSWAKGIVSIHIAGEKSGTCNAAALAAQEIPIPVTVIDTATTAMGEGFVVLEAARAAQAGASMEEVVQKARSVIPNVGLLALLESVTYALKGGRLSSAAGKVGSLLRIQPLIQVQSNRLGIIGQARRRTKGVATLMDKMLDQAKDDPTHLTVHYAEDREEGRTLLENLRANLNCVESYLMRVPVELGVHSGPGAIGIGYYVEREEVGLVQQLEQKLGRLSAQAKEAIRSRLPTPGPEDKAVTEAAPRGLPAKMG